MSITWPPAAPKPGGAKVFVLDAERRWLLGQQEVCGRVRDLPGLGRRLPSGSGFAIPEKDAETEARAVRDELVRDALPTIAVRAGAGALALEAKSDVD